MKEQAYMIIAVIMLVTVAGLSTARAQTNGSTELRANIPFEFSVGDRTMPAGEYIVCYPNLASGMKVVHLRGKDGGASALVHTNSIAGNTQGNARLVFNRYDNRNFFAQAWLTDNTGVQARKSRDERAMAKEFASIKRATQMVALVRQQ
jgi:hypothetical protein